MKMAVFRNGTDRHARIVIGRRPGEPPYVFECAPGEFFEGPESYANVFAREASLQLSSAEERDASANAVVAATIEGKADAAPDGSPEGEADSVRKGKRGKGKADAAPDGSPGVPIE